MAALITWASWLAWAISSIDLSAVSMRGTLPAVWSAPWAVTIMVIPVASTTRGS